MPILRNENPINLEEEKVEAETAPTHNRCTVCTIVTHFKKTKKIPSFHFLTTYFSQGLLVASLNDCAWQIRRVEFR